MRDLVIVQIINASYKPIKPFRIIEKVITIDGARDRITAHSFATLEEAQAFVRDNQ
jgi:hypothetical protein